MVSIPAIPKRRPDNCRKLNCAFNQIIAITNANSGVVEFKIDKVPVFKNNAELANKRKGNTA